jgi:hypothetical protein
MRIVLGTDDGTSPPYISGGHDKTQEAENEAIFDGQRKTINKWFDQLGQNSSSSNIDFLNRMKKGFEEMENDFYKLRAREFKLVDLNQQEFWDLFFEARSFLDGALAEYEEKKSKTQLFFKQIRYCRLAIDNFRQKLNAVELTITSANAENADQTDNQSVA